MSTTVTVETWGPGGLISTEQVELPGAQRGYDFIYRRWGEPAYDALRQWALDAQAAYDDWPTKTDAQKDAAMRETIRRLGVLADRMADAQLIQGRA